MPLVVPSPEIYGEGLPENYDENSMVQVTCTQCGEKFKRHYYLSRLPHQCQKSAEREIPSDRPVRIEAKFEDDHLAIMHAMMPSRKRHTDAGYDLHSIEELTLQPKQSKLVRTGIRLSVPPGWYYTIEGRSSLWMIGIFPNRGIIDAGYNGEVKVSLVNVSDDEYNVARGDRIAQIILHRQYHADFVTVDKFSPAYDARGTKGWGSSGK